MADDEHAIQVEGVAFQIPASGVDALLRGEGIAVRLSALNVRVSEAALNAILARLAPPGQTGEVQATLSAGGVEIDRREGEKTLHLDVAVNQLRLSITDGELRLESG